LFRMGHIWQTKQISFIRIKQRFSVLFANDNYKGGEKMKTAIKKSDLSYQSLLFNLQRCIEMLEIIGKEEPKYLSPLTIAQAKAALRNGSR
jgi:hypothetical protein